MAFISFALTTSEFLNDKKTVTRRDWKERHFLQWCKYWDSGKIIHDAWDKVPFAKGKKIGQFKLTHRPYQEKLINMPFQDLLKEGGMCRTKAEYYKLIKKDKNDFVTVIRFKRI